jgi:NAD(P)-dependent dehydrogenase (short-subunit alcohol dehydrogenase family)
MMKAFANELAKYRIRVNTVHPTGVRVPVWAAPVGYR